ncbi:MAG: hypothetical protein CMG32_01915 [Candidatus Marinimicrobia bacterium]|nr:hypothetical protein [Candidatus Neomarinimicrobiota bacterium]
MVNPPCLWFSKTVLAIYVSYVCKLVFTYNIKNTWIFVDNEHKDIHPIYFRTVSLNIATKIFKK